MQIPKRRANQDICGGRYGRNCVGDKSSVNCIKMREFLE
jgi:hypothetical protein